MPRSDEYAVADDSLEFVAETGDRVPLGAGLELGLAGPIWQWRDDPVVAFALPDRLAEIGCDAVAQHRDRDTRLDADPSSEEQSSQARNQPNRLSPTSWVRSPSLQLK